MALTAPPEWYTGFLIWTFVLALENEAALREIVRAAMRRGQTAGSDASSVWTHEEATRTWLAEGIKDWVRAKAPFNSFPTPLDEALDSIEWAEVVEQVCYLARNFWGWHI